MGLSFTRELVLTSGNVIIDRRALDAEFTAKKGDLVMNQFKYLAVNGVEKVFDIDNRVELYFVDVTPVREGSLPLTILERSGLRKVTT